MRGFLMFWVIFGHITEVPAQFIYIYSFHMPAYFFLTGITFRFDKSESFAEFAVNKFFGLMIPYFILSALVSPLREWLEIVGEVNTQSFTDLLLGTLFSNSDTGYKMASNTLWFIPCLFVSVIIFDIIMRVCRKRALPVTILALAMTMAACLAGLDHGTGGIWHWKGGVFCVLFVLAGWLMSDHIEKVEDALFERKKAACVMLLVLICAGFFVSKYNRYVSIIHNEYKSVILFYISAFATTIALALILMMLSHSEKALKVLAPADIIGKNTLPYIAFQVPVMKLMWYYMPQTFGTRAMPWDLIQTIILYFALLPLACLVDKALPRRMPESLKLRLRRGVVPDGSQHPETL